MMFMTACGLPCPSTYNQLRGAWMLGELMPRLENGGWIFEVATFRGKDLVPYVWNGS